MGDEWYDGSWSGGRVNQLEIEMYSESDVKRTRDGAQHCAHCGVECVRLSTPHVDVPESYREEYERGALCSYECMLARGARWWPTAPKDVFATIVRSHANRHVDCAPDVPRRLSVEENRVMLEQVRATLAPLDALAALRENSELVHVEARGGAKRRR